MKRQYYSDYGSFSSGYFETGEELTGYSNYANLSQKKFSDRAQLIASMAVEPILIAGCGYGYTVEHLNRIDVTAYGMDVSEFAVSQAPISVDDQIIIGDLLSDASMKQISNELDEEMTTVVTETCMSCFTDLACKDVCNRLAGLFDNVVHIVYTDESDIKPEYYNIKTIEDWRALSDQTWIPSTRVGS